MERRNMLKLIGALGGGAAVVTGTGAFSSVEAERRVDIEVVGDASAYLSISEVDGSSNGQYLTEESNGEKAIDLTGNNEDISGGGTGVNAEATTVIDDLFEVRNQGTQEVDLDVTPLAFVDTDGPNTLGVLVVPKTSFPSVTLPVGEKEIYSLIAVEFSPTGADLSVDDGTIEFLAEAT